MGIGDASVRYLAMVEGARATSLKYPETPPLSRRGSVPLADDYQSSPEVFSKRQNVFFDRRLRSRWASGQLHDCFYKKLFHPTW